MRKIASFYYLNYPDGSPSDPLDAYSEVYVEVGEDDATPEKFDETFSLHVYTVECLRKRVSETGPIAIPRSVVVIDRFDDETVRKAVEGILDNIEDFGTKVGD